MLTTVLSGPTTCSGFRGGSGSSKAARIPARPPKSGPSVLFLAPRGSRANSKGPDNLIWSQMLGHLGTIYGIKMRHFGPWRKRAKAILGAPGFYFRRGWSAWSSASINVFRSSTSAEQPSVQQTQCPMWTLCWVPDSQVAPM